jgi:hypothetical protein
MKLRTDRVSRIGDDIRVNFHKLIGRKMNEKFIFRAFHTEMAVDRSREQTPAILNLSLSYG